LLVAIGLNEPTLQRIRDHGAFEVTADPSQALGATIIALSTRSPRGQTVRMPADVDPENTPVVVICHPGGEETAVTLMQRGCAGVIAEGNECALDSFVDPESHTQLLVEGYLEQQGEGRSGRSGGRLDPITSLPEENSFETHISELLAEGASPNLMMLRITNLDVAQERTDVRAVSLLRRRLASFYSDAARRYSCKVFTLSDSVFAVVDAASLLVNPQKLASELIEITEAFRPGGIKLRLAVGAVIGSAETDVAALREQAEQAVLAAAQSGGSAFVTSDDVTVLLASATEYNVAQLLVSFVDQQVANAPGHSARVAEMAADIAAEVGYHGRDLCNLRLAALLHDVGRVPLGAEGQGNDETHPERGARYLLASAGPEIANAVRYHTERWDGAGPAALVEDDIPLSARIIAVAKVADAALHPNGGEPPAAPDEIIARLRRDAGSRLDPDLVETTARLLGGS
jgi:HD-GYP domain-containing protein (c-di-GMP phosphodiesterase class II)